MADGESHPPFFVGGDTIQNGLAEFLCGLAELLCG